MMATETNIALKAAEIPHSARRRFVDRRVRACVSSIISTASAGRWSRIEP
jgi:hypothetical protein